MVVLSLGLNAPPLTGTKPRFCYPTTFLFDAAVPYCLRSQPLAIAERGMDWWGTALDNIQKVALQYHSTAPKQPKVGEAKLLSLLQRSVLDHVPQEVYQVLATHGYIPSSLASAYSVLVHLYELTQKDRAGTRVLGQLKGALAAAHLNSQDTKGCREEVFKLMRELQTRKHLQRLRDTQGVLLTEPRAIVKALVEHWDEVSTKYGKGVTECECLLGTLSMSAEIARYGAALSSPSC